MQPAPISERRLAANRANARKSTGPRTPEGKRRVSQNACRHRLYARLHTLTPHYQAFLHDRAHRNTIHIQDPVLRALRYEFFIASGYEELLWANQDSLLNYWVAECQGDPYEANVNYFSDETSLEALHRFHAHHAHRMDAILKALIRYSRFAAKRQGLTCDNPQALAETLIQAALRRTRQPDLNPPQPPIEVLEQQQTQPEPAVCLHAGAAGNRTATKPTPQPRRPIAIVPINPTASTTTASNPPRPAHPRGHNVICITRAKAPPPYLRQAA